MESDLFFPITTRLIRNKLKFDKLTTTVIRVLGTKTWLELDEKNWKWGIKIMTLDPSFRRHGFKGKQRVLASAAHILKLEWYRED